MSTNRLYAVFALVMTLGLAVAALLVGPLVNSTPKFALVKMAGPSQGESRASLLAADQARFEFRRGEWFGGREPDAPVDVEIQRFLRYAAEASARAKPAVDPARDDWYAAEAPATAKPVVDPARDDWYATK